MSLNPVCQRGGLKLLAHVVPAPRLYLGEGAVAVQAGHCESILVAQVKLIVQIRILLSVYDLGVHGVISGHTSLSAVHLSSQDREEVQYMRLQ